MASRRSTLVAPARLPPRVSRQSGSVSGVLLTLSVLTLVMALGFVFGRVVIARAYIRAAPSIQKSVRPATAGRPAEAAPDVVYEQGQQGRPEVGPRPMQPQEVPDEPGQGRSASSDTAAVPGDQAAPPEGNADSASVDVRYAVQVGMFASEQEARDAADRLTTGGYPARIEVERQGSRTDYRVLTGRYRSESNALRALDQVKDAGFPEAFVVGR